MLVLVFLLFLAERNVLRDKVFGGTRYAVVVRPAVYFGNFARPVAVSRLDRGRPFQRIGAPGILRTFFSPEQAGEKVVQENEQ